MQVIYEGNKYGVKIAGELAEEFLVCDRLDWGRDVLSTVLFNQVLE